MEINVYNVIWADDDIDSYRDDEDAFGILDSHHVKIIDWAHTSNELREKLDEWGDKVDAVITDGNFDKKKTVGVGNSTSGLSDVLSFINEYNKRRFIPFFLYTGKGNILKDKYPDGELDYFRNMGRYFEKGNFSKLLIKLKANVDHINSEPFRIRNKYAKEFEAAKLINDAERNLDNGLLFLYEDNSWKDVQDFFNPARKIVERIKDKCIEMNILPCKTSLNNASRIFSGVDVFIGLKEEFMPKPLAESFFYFLKITQDGSHDENDMNLGVDKYVRDNKNINLYRTILYIAMDLLLWFNDLYNKYKENKEPLWEDKYIDEGRVCTGFSNGKKYLYTKKYELQPNKDIALKEGDVVRIYKCENQIYTKGNVSCYVKREYYRKYSE